MSSDAFMLCLETRAVGSFQWHSLAFCNIRVILRTADGWFRSQVSAIPADLLPEFTRWVAHHGGKALMDVWEVEVLNSIHSQVCPVDTVNHLMYPKTVGWHVDNLFRQDDGIRLLWAQLLNFQVCAEAKSAPDPEDFPYGCPWCSDTGKVEGDQYLITDIEGIVIHETEQEHAA